MHVQKVLGPSHRGLEETRAWWLAGAGVEKMMVEVLGVNWMG